VLIAWLWQEPIAGTPWGLVGLFGFGMMESVAAGIENNIVK
jgi:hypothetical protein